MPRIYTNIINKQMVLNCAALSKAEEHIEMSLTAKKTEDAEAAQSKPNNLCEKSCEIPHGGYIQTASPERRM
jgi:hypothetical protein